MREVKLPSGAVLKVNPAPFAISRSLFQAFLEEAKGIEFKKSIEIPELMKNLVCFGFSSKKIESILGECFKRCQINDGLKIDEDTFEKPEMRQDYPVVCLEVAMENILPFGKSLSVVFERLSVIIPSDPT